MSRSGKLIAFLLVALGLTGFLCIGAFLIVSGGNPVDFVQTSLIRIALAGRDDDLAASVSDNDTPVRFTVNPGDTPRLIAQNLAADNLITDADLFVDYVRVRDLDVQLEAGTYFLTRAQTIPEIALAITDSRSSQIVFTILEGWRIEEIAAQIDNNPRFGFSGAEFLALTNAVDVPGFAARHGVPLDASLEGFLFPDTYQLPASVSAADLRDILLDTFEDRIAADNITTSGASQGFSVYEVVTLASIIQREAVRVDEHPRISSVYRNRLAINMKLDADPTIQYAIGFRNGTWWSQITVANYSNVISPYNTYLDTGLPPGPIANPGIDAIRAAVQPEQTDFLYFRARCTGDGYHNFARTFEEQLANAC